MGPKGRSYVRRPQMWPATAEMGIMAAKDNYHALDTSWFAVWTRSRQEKVAAAMLEALEVPHFLPLKSEVHRWSDRKQTVTIPLFSGYLFVRLNPNKDSRLRVLNVPGIAGLVGSQAGPLPIPDYEIENIRTVIAQKMQYSTYLRSQSGIACASCAGRWPALKVRCCAPKRIQSLCCQLN